MQDSHISDVIEESIAALVHLHTRASVTALEQLVVVH
jgi:hypothetical protein